jgi:hypothetical protein
MQLNAQPGCILMIGITGNTFGPTAHVTILLKRCHISDHAYVGNVYHPMSPAKLSFTLPIPCRKFVGTYLLVRLLVFTLAGLNCRLCCLCGNATHKSLLVFTLALEPLSSEKDYNSKVAEIADIIHNFVPPSHDKLTLDIDELHAIKGLP